MNLPRIRQFAKEHRTPLIVGGIGAVGLVGVWLMMKGSTRSVPNFQWTSPSCPADKMQYLVDYTQLGFGGQGTVYINSNCNWDSGKQALVVRSTPDTITKVPVKFPVGWTCSRLTNAVCGYWLNVGPAFRNRNGYSSEYAMIAPSSGKVLEADGSLETFYGYADYAVKVAEHMSEYTQVYGLWDQLGQVNVWIQESGHTGIFLKVDEAFRLRDPHTRSYLPHGLYRLSADGGRPNQVYSVGRTTFKAVPGVGTHVSPLSIYTLKSGNNNWRCRVDGRPTYPLLFEGGNA